MSTRIYILAKELELSNKEILATLTHLGVNGKTASSNIEDNDVEKLREHFGKIPKSSAMPKPKPVEKKPETPKTEAAKPAVKQVHEAPKPHAPRPEAPKHETPKHEAPKHHAPKHEAPPKPPVHHHVPPKSEQRPDAGKAETIRPGHYRPEQKKPEPSATPVRSDQQQRPPYQGRTDRPPEQRRPYESRPPQGAQTRPPYQSRPGGGTPPQGQGQQPSRPFERKPYEQRPAGSAPPQGQARPPYQGRPAGGAPQGQGYGTGAPRPSTGGYQGRKPHAGGAGQGQYQSRPQHRPHSKTPLTPLPPRPQYPMPMSHNIDSSVKPEDIGKPIVLLEEMVEGKVPDRFKKDFEADKVEKFKARPGMQRAFQAIRKIDQKKFNDPKGRRGPGQRGFSDEPKQQLPTAPRKKNLKIQEGITVKEFAELISVKMPDVIKKFMELGYMPTINQPVDMDAALLVATGFGVKLEIASVDEEPEAISMEEDVALLIPRPPVVTIMGHVDHGKTSLLDAIRETKVTETEAGGITQHIGAYKVSLKGKEIVFLDTPGHEAFTALRARGAKITDIVVLVVAADDGVKPQTVEAINHAKAAGVPIIVAVNKIDKPDANSAKVRNDLAELEIVSEEWGGKNIFAEVSAKKRIGIEHLLEMILLQADMMELKANPDKLARGVIIESKLDKGRGPIATVLVQAGTLKVGDAFLSGVNAGRVRALIDDLGHRSTEAGPSTPVEVIGFSEVPNAGDHFTVMEDERKARSIALSRLAQQKKLQVASHHKKLTLDEVYAKIKEGEIKDLNIIVKADVQGSIEAMKQSLEGITHPEVKVRVIHYSIGGINESDVMLATASDAIIVGFNVRPESKAANLAEKEGVDIRLYNIIYEAIDDVKKALEGMLEPTLKEKILGRAEVRQTYQVSKIGTIAGCMVTEGYVSRASEGIRLIRDNIVVFEGKISTLKRFKDDVKEVQTGYECGITIENYNDLKVGDIIENYIIEKIAAKL